MSGPRHIGSVAVILSSMLLCLSSMASAQTQKFGFCYANERSTLYLSPIFALGPPAGTSELGRFNEFIYRKYYGGKQVRLDTECPKFPTKAAAETYRAQVAPPQYSANYVETGWTPSKAKSSAVPDG